LLFSTKGRWVGVLASTIIAFLLTFIITIEIL